MLLVDGHVHLHSCFGKLSFLTSARSNFTAASRDLGLDAPPTGVLLLTESSGIEAFQHLARHAAVGPPGSWTVHSTLEADSLIARLDGAARIIVIAGRQIASADGLEVLALGSSQAFDDGLSLEKNLAAVGSSGALAVVPWGFGKWGLRRGRRLASLLDQVDPASFFLGDNGGRPRLARDPALFARAAARGVRILPGTDALPFPRQVRRVASYGFVVERPIDLKRPSAELKEILRDLSFRPRRYGRRRRLLPFVLDQVAMQLLKHAGRRR